MKTQVVISRALASTAVLLLAACATVQPPPPPRGARSLDQPPAGSGNRYLQGAENLPPGAATPPPVQMDPNAPYTPPPPPGDPAAVQPPAMTQPPTTEPAPVEAPPPSTNPAPTPPVAEGDQLPFGIKVPDKPGMVLSPYDKTAGIVDVQGIAPGKKVKCPYTGKIFRVP
jgi:hypothetical protein